MYRSVSKILESAIDCAKLKCPEVQLTLRAASINCKEEIRLMSNILYSEPRSLSVCEFKSRLSAHLNRDLSWAEVSNLTQYERRQLQKYAQRERLGTKDPTLASPYYASMQAFLALTYKVFISSPP